MHRTSSTSTGLPTSRARGALVFFLCFAAQFLVAHCAISHMPESSGSGLFLLHLCSPVSRGLLQVCISLSALSSHVSVLSIPIQYWSPLRLSLSLSFFLSLSLPLSLSPSLSLAHSFIYRALSDSPSRNLIPIPIPIPVPPIAPQKVVEAVCGVLWACWMGFDAALNAHRCDSPICFK